MADTTFTAQVTKILAAWLQDVNDLVYRGIGTGGPATPFLPAGTGAVARTAQNKMRDVVSVKDFDALGDGVTDDTAAIQAANDAIVSSGVKTTLLFPGATYKCNSGLTFNALYVNIIANGATLDFSSLSSGSAVTVTGADVVNLGGMTIVGNSNSGSVKGINLTGTIAQNIVVIRISDFVVRTFGTGIYLGDYTYIVSFNHFEVADCTIDIDSEATTGGGSRLVFSDFLLTSGVSGAIGIKNTNINADIYCFGGAIDTDVIVNQSGGRIHFYGIHLEEDDWSTAPIIIAGGAVGTAHFEMFGGEILSNQGTITAANLVTIDNAITAGAGGCDFHGVYFQFGTTASGNFAGGAGAEHCRIFNPRGSYPFNIYSGGGIAYNGSEAIGTWTPALQGTSVAGAQTYTDRAGEWYRRGNTITASFRINMSALDGATAGDAQIAGLPFASKASLTQPGLAIGAWANINIGANVQLTGALGPSGTLINLLMTSAAGALSNVPITSISATTLITGTVTYQI